MAAPRKNPPKDTVEVTEQMASQGYSIVGIAKKLGVSVPTFKRWCEDYEEIQQAFDFGRETQRQALIALITQSAVAGKGANANAMFLLKTMHGFREFDSPNTKVDVAVNTIQPVLVVKDHGTDEEWAAKCAAQQRALTQPETQPRQIEAPKPVQIAPCEVPAAPAYVSPAHEQASAPASPAAPYYGPPRFPWEPQAVPVTANAPEPISGDSAMPPAPRFEAPVWRGRA